MNWWKAAQCSIKTASMDEIAKTGTGWIDPQGNVTATSLYQHFNALQNHPQHGQMAKEIIQERKDLDEEAKSREEMQERGEHPEWHGYELAEDGHLNYRGEFLLKLYQEGWIRIGVNHQTFQLFAEGMSGAIKSKMGVLNEIIKSLDQVQGRRYALVPEPRDGNSPWSAGSSRWAMNVKGWKAAQTENPLDKARSLGITVTPDGKLVLYHGTRFYKQIKATGFRQGTYFGATWNDAAHHGWKPWEKGKFYVMKVAVDPQDVHLSSLTIYANKPVAVHELEPPTTPKRDVPFLNNNVRNSLLPDQKIEWINYNRIKPIHGRNPRPGKPYREGDPYEAMIVNDRDELQDGYHRHEDLKKRRYSGYVPVVRYRG